MTGEFDRLVRKKLDKIWFDHVMEEHMITQELLWGSPYGPHYRQVHPVELVGLRTRFT